MAKKTTKTVAKKTTKTVSSPATDNAIRFPGYTQLPYGIAHLAQAVINTTAAGQSKAGQALMPADIQAAVTQAARDWFGLAGVTISDKRLANHITFEANVRKRLVVDKTTGGVMMAAGKLPVAFDCMAADGTPRGTKPRRK